MSYLVGFLLLILILALILLIVPAEERRNLLRSLQRRRPADEKKAPPPAQMPEEEQEGPAILRGAPGEAGVPSVGRPSWGVRVWERILLPLRPRPKAPPTREAPKGPAPASMVRKRVAVLALVILVAAFLIGRFLERRLTPTREGQLTVLVGTIAPRGSAGEELSAFLRRAFEEAGLGDRVAVRTQHTELADPATAVELLRRRHADLLLWGEETSDDPPRYTLSLAIYPRADESAPEFEEYVRTFATPPAFPLNAPGISREDLASLLTWLARFYLGEFGTAESATPQLPETAEAVVRYHEGALRWLRGDYAGARSAFEHLVARSFVTTLDGSTSESYTCPSDTSPAFCAALQNDLAVTILTQESLGQVPGTALDEAIRLLENAVLTDDRPLYRYNLGRAYMARGRADLALPHLDKAVQQDRDNAAALAWLSMACTAAGESGRARAMADRAIEKDRALAEGELALGLHLLAQGDLKGSERVLAQARKLAEAETSRRRSREAALREGNRPNARLATYASAWARRSEATLAQVHLAQAQLAVRRAEQAGRTPFFVWLWRILSGEKAPADVARAEIDAALGLHPNWSPALRLQAQLLSAQGKVQEAIDTLRALQQQDPRDVATYQALADELEKRWRQLRGQPGQEAQAQEVLAQIREQYRLLIDRGLSPAQGYLGLGRIAQEAGDSAAARQAYLDAIASDPQFAEAYLRLGWLERDQGKEEEALGYLEKAAQHAGGKSWIRVLAHTARGEILLEQSLRSEGEPVRSDLRRQAREAFQAALNEQPGMASALNGMGRIAYEEGDLDGAEGRFLQVLDHDRTNFGALYGLGRVYEARSRTDIALRYFRRAVAARGDSIAARYHLGVAAFAQLNTREAQGALEWVRGRCQDAQVLSFDDRQACQGVTGWLEKLGASRP